jgi:hypothetical protein
VGTNILAEVRLEDGASLFFPNVDTRMLQCHNSDDYSLTVEFMKPGGLSIDVGGKLLIALYALRPLLDPLYAPI